MRYGLIGQLDSQSASPHCFVSKKQKEQLLNTGQCVATDHDDVLRKTPKYGRIVDDRKIVFARPGVLRGLSSRIGATLAEALRSSQDKVWAEPMLEQIKRRVCHASSGS